jgi:Holliday junction resolvasome RuvABC endonuclease subunit
MKRTANTFRVLAFDPSIRAWGWSVLNASGKVINTGCIKTDPSHKKLKIRKGDDRCRRISELNQAFNEIIKSNHISLIVSEQPHGSQSASAAVMIGITTAMTQSLSDLLGVPLEWYSEADAKQAVFKRNSCSKAEMIEAIGGLYDVEWSGVKYKDEAIADSIAVYHAATKTSTFLKFYRNE